MLAIVRPNDNQLPMLKTLSGTAPPQAEAGCGMVDDAPLVDRKIGQRLDVQGLAGVHGHGR
jgi:hypothetical protein